MQCLHVQPGEWNSGMWRAHEYVALGYPYTHLHVSNMIVAKHDSRVPRICGTVHSVVHEAPWSCRQAFSLPKFEAVQGLRLHMCPTGSGVSEGTPDVFCHTISWVSSAPLYTNHEHSQQPSVSKSWLPDCLPCKTDVRTRMQQGSKQYCWRHCFRSHRCGMSRMPDL
jgi:hypothetical protein